MRERVLRGRHLHRGRVSPAWTSRNPGRPQRVLPRTAVRRPLRVDARRDPLGLAASGVQGPPQVHLFGQNVAERPQGRPHPGHTRSGRPLWLHRAAGGHQRVSSPSARRLQLLQDPGRGAPLQPGPTGAALPHIHRPQRQGAASASQLPARVPGLALCDSLARQFLRPRG